MKKKSLKKSGFVTKTKGRSLPGFWENRHIVHAGRPSMWCVLKMDWAREGISEKGGDGIRDHLQSVKSVYIVPATDSVWWGGRVKRVDRKSGDRRCPPSLYRGE